MTGAATRVLFIENSYGLGGSTVSLCTLLSALSPDYRAAVVLSRTAQERFLREHVNPNPPVTVVTCRPSLKETRLLAPVLPRVHALPRIPAAVIRYVISALDVPLVIAPYVRRMRQFARRVGVDVIQHNNGFDLAAVLLKKLLGVPLVTYQRGWQFDSLTVRRLGNCVDSYVANSATTRDHLIALGIEPRRIDIVYPPVDLARFHPAVGCAAQRRELAINDGERCFGVIGALTDYRGHRTFLRAAAQVLARVPTSRAVVIGDAPTGEEAYKHELLTLARQLGIGDRVVFTGYRPDIPELIQMLPSAA
jgi:glycosyltransferase involved in cell wall biosynthesis